MKFSKKFPPRGDWIPPLLVPGVTAMLIAGCAWAEFKPYQGVQRAWPTASGSFMKQGTVIPVYYGYPPKPYVVLGIIETTTAPIRRKQAVSFAARRGQEMGADALLVLEEGKEYVGTIGQSIVSGASFSRGSFSSTSTLAPFPFDRVDTRGQYSGSSSYSSYGTGISTPVYRGKAAVVAIQFQQ